MAELTAKKTKRKVRLKKARKAIAKINKDKTYFRYNMIKSFQMNPLLCKCGSIMEYKETYDPLKGGEKNDRQYRDGQIHI